MRRTFLILSTIFLFAACAPAATDSRPDLVESVAAIRGGSTVGPTEATRASTVTLYRYEKDKCTVSLLTDTLAVTAAHCVDPRHRGRVEFEPGFRLHFGDDTFREIIDWRIHPDWVTATARKGRSGRDEQNGDVALLRFAGGLPAGFAPALLLPVEVPLNEGDTVLLAGYGSRDDRRLDEESGRELRAARVPVLRNRAAHYEVHLDQRAGSGACKGDSGGPAFKEINGQALLWGVTSRMIEWEDGVEFLYADALPFTRIFGRSEVGWSRPGASSAN